MARPLTKDQRKVFAEKIMEWGNLVFVGLVVAQIVPGTGLFRLKAAIAGFFYIVVAYIVSYLIMRGGEDK